MPTKKNVHLTRSQQKTKILGATAKCCHQAGTFVGYEETGNRVLEFRRKWEISL